MIHYQYLWLCRLIKSKRWKKVMETPDTEWRTQFFCAKSSRGIHDCNKINAAQRAYHIWVPCWTMYGPTLSPKGVNRPNTAFRLFLHWQCILGLRCLYRRCSTESLSTMGTSASSTRRSLPATGQVPWKTQHVRHHVTPRELASHGPRCIQNCDQLPQMHANLSEKDLKATSESVFRQRLTWPHRHRHSRFAGQDQNGNRFLVNMTNRYSKLTWAGKSLERAQHTHRLFLCQLVWTPQDRTLLTERRWETIEVWDFRNYM